MALCVGRAVLSIDTLPPRTPAPLPTQGDPGPWGKDFRNLAGEKYMEIAYFCPAEERERNGFAKAPPPLPSGLEMSLPVA